MVGLPRQELATIRLAHEFAILRLYLTADSDEAGAAFQFPAFEGTVIHVHVMSLGRYGALIVWVVDHQIGVSADLDATFSRVEPEQLGGSGAGHIHKLIQR